MSSCLSTARPTLSDQIPVGRIKRIVQVPMVLEICQRVTGMRFVAIAHVTDKKWLTCAALDEINLGLKPGDELPLETTICNEVREHGTLVVFDDALADPHYSQHQTPKLYNFRSYISVPIFTPDGEFFGTLCAIDPEPRALNNDETIGMFRLFADLIGAQLKLTA